MRRPYTRGFRRDANQPPAAAAARCLKACAAHIHSEHTGLLTPPKPSSQSPDSRTPSGNSVSPMTPAASFAALVIATTDRVRAHPWCKAVSADHHLAPSRREKMKKSLPGPRLTRRFGGPSAAAFGRFGCPCFRAKRSNFATWPPTPNPALLLQRRSVWGGGSPPDDAADCSSVQLDKSLPRAAGGTARRM